MSKVPMPLDSGKSHYSVPVEKLPAKVLADLAAMPCVCSVIKPERRPCTTCRARASLTIPPPATVRP